MYLMESLDVFMHVKISTFTVLIFNGEINLDILVP